LKILIERALDKLCLDLLAFSRKELRLVYIVIALKYNESLGNFQENASKRINSTAILYIVSAQLWLAIEQRSSDMHGWSQHYITVRAL
jgi:hypothetical protein